MMRFSGYHMLGQLSCTGLGYHACGVVLELIFPAIKCVATPGSRGGVSSRLKEGMINFIHLGD